MNTSTRERRTFGGVAPLLAATAVSVTGDGATIAAVPLLASTLTTNPAQVGAVAAATMLPWLLFSLHAGALVDRWPRRRTMLTADLARAAVLTGVVALQLTGRLNLVALAVAVIILGASQCFFAAASAGMIPAIVGRDKTALTHVNGRYWAIDTAGRNLLGPTLGSVTFTLNRAVPFAADAVSFLLSAALVTRLPENTPARATKTSVAVDIRQGLTFIGRNRELRQLALLVVGNNSAYSLALATFVLYARRILHTPTAGYGALLAATAVGAILAGWWAKPLTRRLEARHALAVTCATQCAAWTAIAATGSPWVAGGALALLGAASNLGTVALVTRRQELTPDELLGRVTSVFRLAGVGITALAALAGGILAAHYGLHAPLITAAVILAAAAAYAIRK
jgi:MFS family permease